MRAEKHEEDKDEAKHELEARNAKEINMVEQPRRSVGVGTTTTSAGTGRNRGMEGGRDAGRPS